jgi:hypothetical protein
MRYLNSFGGYGAKNIIERMMAGVLTNEWGGGLAITGAVYMGCVDREGGRKRRADLKKNVYD